MCKEDLHRCGDCLKEFGSFEAFLIHKLLYEKYKLKLEPSKRIPGLRIPLFVKIHTPADSVKQLSGLNVEVVPSETVCSVGKKTYSIGAKTCSVLKASVLDKSSVCDKQTTDSKKTDCERKKVTPTEIEETGENVTRKENESETGLCDLSVRQDVDEESDDNASVWSQAESLRIDESANTKDNLSSPHPEIQLDNELKQASELHCRLCNRYYKNKVVLRVHKETVHCGGRPFTCNTCHQAFKTKGSLVRHVRSHTGEKPFYCRECGRAFRDSGSLSRHVKGVHRKLLNQTPISEVKIVVTQLITEAASKAQLTETNSANS